MTLQVKYNKLENDCFNPLTVDPNPPHDLNHFSLFLRLENTAQAFAGTTSRLAYPAWDGDHQGQARLCAVGGVAQRARGDLHPSDLRIAHPSTYACWAKIFCDVAEPAAQSRLGLHYGDSSGI